MFSASKFGLKLFTFFLLCPLDVRIYIWYLRIIHLRIIRLKVYKNMVKSCCYSPLDSKMQKDFKAHHFISSFNIL